MQTIERAMSWLERITGSLQSRIVNVKSAAEHTAVFREGRGGHGGILEGGLPLSRNFYVRTDVNFNWLYVRKLK